MGGVYMSQADAKKLKAVYDILDSMSDDIKPKEHLLTNLYQMCDVLEFSQFEYVNIRYMCALNGNKEGNDD